jgi:hypothetical protein
MGYAFQFYFLKSSFLVITLFLPLFCHAQSIPERFDINGGISASDFINVGMRYEFNQNQVGINIGVKPEKYTIKSLSYYRHTFGKSKHTTLKPWFAKAAVSYFKDTQEPPFTNIFQRTIIARLHAGRHIYFSKRIGFMFAVGPIYRISFKREYKNGGTLPGKMPNDFFPASIDLALFFKPMVNQKK